MTSLDVEKYFQRLSRMYNLQDFSNVYVGEQGSIAAAPHQKATVVRVLRETDALSWDQKIAVMRAEVRASQPSFGFVLDMRLVESLTPGDAIVTVRMRPDLDQALLRVFTLASASADISEWLTARVSLWREYPQAGQFTVAFMPVSPEGSGGNAYYIVVSKGEAGKITMAHYMEVPWPEYPEWMTPSLQGLLRGSEVEASFDPEAIEQAVGHYIVVNLRSCSRGPPLLPLEEVLPQEELQRRIEAREVVEMGGYVWAPAKKEGFNLPFYLDRMLKHTELFDGAVFDRMDGMQLAPYQAALCKRELDEAREALDKIFRVQQAAYRRLLGGKHAPKMNFGTTPHFVCTAQRVTRVTEEVVERNTFVEVKCVAEDESALPGKSKTSANLTAKYA